MVLNGKGNNIEIGMPLYSGVRHLYIGIPKGKKILPAKPYKVDTPVVYYGSSITQGGCASRPGNSYQGFISRHLKADYINLGFSGNAKGEETMARYIASLLQDHPCRASRPSHHHGLPSEHLVKGRRRTR